MTTTELKVLTLVELTEILRKHQNWLDNRSVETADCKQAVLDNVEIDQAVSNYYRTNEKNLNFCCAQLRNVKLASSSLAVANFTYAEFFCCDFHQANLDYGNFVQVTFNNCNLAKTHAARANFSFARFVRCDLTNARFEKCNFQEAVFRQTDLNNAAALIACNITGACSLNNLLGSLGICRLDFGNWPVTITKQSTQIGCQQKPNEFWLAVENESKELDRMHPYATRWWQQYGSAVKAAILAVQTTS